MKKYTLKGNLGYSPFIEYFFMKKFCFGEHKECLSYPFLFAKTLISNFFNMGIFDNFSGIYKYGNRFFKICKKLDIDTSEEYMISYEDIIKILDYIKRKYFTQDEIDISIHNTLLIVIQYIEFEQPYKKYIRNFFSGFPCGSYVYGGDEINFIDIVTELKLNSLNHGFDDIYKYVNSKMGLPRSLFDEYVKYWKETGVYIYFVPKTTVTYGYDAKVFIQKLYNEIKKNDKSIFLSSPDYDDESRILSNIFGY